MEIGENQDYVKRLISKGTDVGSGGKVKAKIMGGKDLEEIMRVVSFLEEKLVSVLEQKEKVEAELVKYRKFSDNKGRKKKRWQIFTDGQKMAVRNMRKNQSRKYNHKDVFNHLVIENKYTGTYEQVHKYLVHLDVREMMKKRMDFNAILIEFKRKGSRVTERALRKYYDDIKADRVEYFKNKEETNRIDVNKAQN